MPTPPTIAVIANPSGSYVRGLIAGITSYGADYGPWGFQLYSDPLDADLPRRLEADRVAGILARIHDGSLGRRLAKLRVPLVDLRSQHPMRGVPQIVPDGRALMRLALGHLLDRGLRSFAFVGYTDLHYSELDRRSLAALCREQAGIIESGPTDRRGDPRTLLVPYADNMQKHGPTIGCWIEALPKPVGLIAANDMLAAVALVACRARDVAVPDQVAVIGVDDDPVYCQVSSPALSSVDPNAFKGGYQAAAMLHGMLEGRLEPPALTYVEPAGVVARRSTDVLAFAEPDAVRVVRFIRDHACDGLTVGRIVKKMGVSRRTLERLFTEHVGHSPSEEIRRVRLAKIRQLLVGTDIGIEEVARMAGFSHVETMRRVFRGEFGVSPAEYRVRHRPKGGV
jgi:LacI family transcriptional regulator